MVRKNVVDGINGLSNNKDFDEKKNPNSKNFASKMGRPCENVGQVNGYNISNLPDNLFPYTPVILITVKCILSSTTILR